MRDGIAEEMRRDPHIIYLGEGTGERGGSFAHTKNLWQEFGAHADDRHADRRARFHRRRHRRLGQRLPGGGRPDVRRLPLRGRQPDHPAGGQAPLHEQRPAQRADHRAGELGHGQMHRPAPQRLVSPGLGPLPRPDRRRSVEPGRCQGLDENGLPLQRSGVDARTQGAVRQQGAGAQGRVLHPVRRGQHCAAGHRSDDRLLRHAGPSLCRGGREAGRRGNLLRSDRSADDRPLGRRDDRRRAWPRPAVCWSSTRRFRCAASGPKSRRR